ncbi:MAG: hypothetical protein WAO76_11745 [Georgfuchsia sp.]
MADFEFSADVEWRQEINRTARVMEQPSVWFVWVGIELIGAHYLLTGSSRQVWGLICSFAGNRYWTFHSGIKTD